MVVAPPVKTKLPATLWFAANLQGLFTELPFEERFDAAAQAGTGEIAWDFVFEHIRALGYDGWIGCEYRPANETLAGLSWRDGFS
jgi:hydroxypyruvate isomerase